MKRSTLSGIVVALALAVLGRAFLRTTVANAAPPHARSRFEAVLEGRDPASTIRGTARFTETPDGTRVHVVLSGAAPGRHGVHLHANGNCSATDFSSAGGHFAPDGHPHAGPGAKLHHAGDLGNIDVDGSGHGKLTLTTKSLAPGDRSAVGHAVIVHTDADDLSSQPSGNAGARIACGVVHPVKGAG